MNEAERELLESLFRSAVDAVLPERCLTPYLPRAPVGRTVVVGAGKASAAMAQVVVDHYSDSVGGLVITRYGHGLGTSRIGHIDVVEAGHPIPDDAGNMATSRVLDLVRECGPDDLILCLLSGGGSALLTMPAAGITLDDKQDVTRALIASGATIDEINCVRKHLSAVKGGQLALAAHPAQVITLAISDVAGDDPSVIASGPTTADPTTFADARAILNKFDITPPSLISRHLDAALNETPTEEDPRLKNASLYIVASAKQALAAAAQLASERGFESVVLGDEIQGEAREVARAHAALARDYKARGKATALLSGGETTVTIQGSGGGGPNTEYMLALAIELAGEEGICGIACDSDGIDGSEDNAGAMIFPDTLARADALDLVPHVYLTNNDSYGFFTPLRDLVVPGPTLTNVNDLRAILIKPD
jgi:hydroxypyruvate reductase